jgi:hypothetical protein
MATSTAAARADDQLLVDIGQHRGRGLVGEVEVAEHGVAQTDRHAEERLHRRVVRRAADIVGAARPPMKDRLVTVTAAGLQEVGLRQFVPASSLAGMP